MIGQKATFALGLIDPYRNGIIPSGVVPLKTNINRTILIWAVFSETRNFSQKKKKRKFTIFCLIYLT